MIEICGVSKHFPNETAIDYPFIYISAGVRGLQLKLSPQELISYCSIIMAYLISDSTDV